METATFGQLAGVALIILVFFIGVGILVEGWPKIIIYKKDKDIKKSNNQ